MTNLWLDDVRPAPEGWTHAHSVHEAIHTFTTHDVEHASLDHDLGDYAHDGGDGDRLVLWLAEHGHWPTRGISVHSRNPVGAERMLALIDQYGPYPAGWGATRGVHPPA